MICNEPEQVQLNAATIGRRIMRTRVIRIGRSHAVRIPNAVLEQTGLHGEVEMAALSNAVVIRPGKKVRSGWAAAFSRMRKNEDDLLVDDPPVSSTTWDEKEWEW